MSLPDMRHFKAITFDMDGLLLDSERIALQLPTAVATSTRTKRAHAHKKLRRAGILHHFRAIIGGDQVPAFAGKHESDGASSSATMALG
jgi:beta-phosphoglucomutase-like phosphatase (HAD superfamily)